MASNTFIARGIAGLEIPEKGSVEYFDSSTPGFGLRVTSRGHQSWICLYRHRGEKRRYTIGTYPQLGLADAREEAKEVLRRAAKGEDPAMEKKWQRKAKTFRELADLYLEHHAKATKESSGNNRTIWTAGLPARMRPGRPRSHGWRPPVHKDLIPRFGSRKAGEIARRDMLDMLKAIKARGAPIQANRTLEIARKPFNWAIGEELVAHNPCDHIGKLSPENQRSRVLSPAEIRTLWAALDTRSPLVAAAHRLMLATGQLLATTKPGLNKSTVRHV